MHVMRIAAIRRYCGGSDHLHSLAFQTPKLEAKRVSVAARCEIDLNAGMILKRPIRLAEARCPRRVIRLAAGLATIVVCLVSGCTNAPSISVLGAYFPDWLFCIVAGVVLTVVIYLSLKRLRIDPPLGPPAVMYPVLAAFLSLAVWLLLFQI